jgi:hypothetical protein
MTSGAGTQFVTGNEWNNKDSFSFFNFYYLYIFYLCNIFELKITDNTNQSINNTFFIFYFTQGCSLHSFKSSRGVGVKIVEKDNIL